MEQKLRIGDVARMLEVSIETVRRLADEGTLLATRGPGGNRRFSRTQILAFKKRREESPTSDGEIEAEALRLLGEGHSDAEIVGTLRMPLARVHELRSARGETPRKRPAIDPDLEVERDAPELPSERPSLARLRRVRQRLSERRTQLQQRLTMRRVSSR